jgi:branched-chain amino acid transport system ATP-binding protein
MSTLLAATNLSVSYGEAKALFNVSVELGAGEALTVLGSNGAGKSTLGKAIAGVAHPSEGTVLLDGRDITRLSGDRIRRLGVIYLPEGRAIFPTLSVAENLRIACWTVRGKKARRDEAIRRSLQVFPILGERLKQRAGTLSGGEQQMLALARVLVDPPKLIIADEPSLGLAPMVVDMVFHSLDEARQQGAAVILIEQFVERALAFGDNAVVLQRGHVTWRGRCQEAAPAVLSRYLGVSSNGT